MSNYYGTRAIVLDAADMSAKATSAAAKRAARRDRIAGNVASVAALNGKEKPDYAANLAFFLQDVAGNIHGQWHGPMSADDQKLLFGRFLGKGTIHIDGQAERLEHSKKVGFGQDYEVTANLKWSELK
jgi:hypothetical protein